MKHKQFQKSLLAIVVGAISTQVLAVEVDLGAGKTQFVSETYNESLILTGQTTQVINSTNMPPAGLGVAGTHIQGSLINRADITLNADGNTVRGFALDPMFWTGPLNLSPGSVTGDVLQAGNIRMNNGGDEGLEIGATTIGGSVINSGTISSTPPSAPAPSPGFIGGGEGIYLHGTTIGGDVSNTGLIDMAGEGAIGIVLDRNNADPVTIGGKLLNSGTIRATGEGAWGSRWKLPPPHCVSKTAACCRPMAMAPVACWCLKVPWITSSTPAPSKAWAPTPAPLNSPVPRSPRTARRARAVSSTAALSAPMAPPSALTRPTRSRRLRSTSKPVRFAAIPVSPSTPATWPR